MAFEPSIAVFDACVLYPFHLRNILVQAAVDRLVQARWTDKIHEEWIRSLASRYPWDYFIGSVHYISESWDIDNPKKLSEWKKRDPWEVWSAYFDRLTLAAESGLFDIIGHFYSPELKVTHDPL